MGRVSFIGFVACLALFLSHPAGADQKDPRLDEFFFQLKQTTELSEGEALTRSIWEVWYEARPENAQELFDRGVAAMDAGEFKRAVEIFTLVTERHPEFAEGWNRRATLYFILGELESSIEDIKRTLLLEPRHFGAISGLGLIYLKQNKLLEARGAFVHALEINPHLANARLNIELINQMLNRNSV